MPTLKTSIEIDTAQQTVWRILDNLPASPLSLYPSKSDSAASEHFGTFLYP
jgi:hypothetical protein